MTPTAARRIEPRSDDIRFATGTSSLGLVLVAQSDQGIVSVLMGDDRDALREDLRRRFPGVTLVDGQGESALGAAVAGVIRFIESPDRHLAMPLDLRGTDFQRAVWRALREIPAGSTASYTDIANRIGRPTSVRAVAQACAANPLAVVVPCHRVVRSDGELAGYRWGLERKRALLDLEASLRPTTFMPPSRSGSSIAAALPDRSSPVPARR